MMQECGFIDTRYGMESMCDNYWKPQIQYWQEEIHTHIQTKYASTKGLNKT